MKTAPKVDTLKKLIGLLRQDAEDGTATLAMISVGQSKMAINAFKAGKGHIPILVRAALLQRLLMTITRLHDGDSDTDSLTNVFRLLGDAAVRSAAIFSPEFEAPLQYAETRWAALQGDPRIDRLRKFRNRYLAHSISKKWGMDKPVFDDITTAAVETFGIVEALGVATAVAPAVLKHVASLYRDRAEEYWRRLAGGVIS